MSEPGTLGLFVAFTSMVGCAGLAGTLADAGTEDRVFILTQMAATAEVLLLDH